MQAPYPSPRRKRQGSLILLHLLSPQKPSFLRGPHLIGTEAVSLCCTCPGVTPGRRYLLSLPCGARTFLIWVLSVPIRGCPPRSRIYCTSWGGKSQMSCKFFSERIYYIICLPVQLSITYTNWEFVEFPVIASQCAHWRGNPLVRRTTSRG